VKKVKKGEYMKTFIRIILFFLILVLLISCSSKEMKDAKAFIDLKDWNNALEKLQSEIKNNPKNVDAYKLIYLAKQNNAFPDYDEKKFLNPFNSNIDYFPQLNEEAFTELINTYDKIEKLNPKSKDPSKLYFQALYKYYKWEYALSLISNSTDDILKSIEISSELRKDKCNNELYVSSLKDFRKCSDLKSNVSDNAFYWWYSLQCDSTYTDSVFVADFRKKYKKSDLNDEIDHIEFSKVLRKQVESYKIKPDSIYAHNIISLVHSFADNHPNFQSENNYSFLLIGYIIASNREYVSYDDGYKYNNIEGLLSYLNYLSKYSTIDEIKINAFESIAEYYENESKNDLAIKVYNKILKLNLSDKLNDKYHYKIGESFQKSANFGDAIKHFEQVKKLTDIQKYSLWQCYKDNGDISKSNILRDELKKSTDPSVSYLMIIADQVDVLTNLKISNLNAEFDDYSINVTGYVLNNMNRTVYDVKVRAEISDKSGNNTKQSYDYIDVIYPNKKSYFEVSVYYGSNMPYSIKYNARIVDYSE